MEIEKFRRIIPEMRKIINVFLSREGIRLQGGKKKKNPEGCSAGDANIGVIQ